MRKVLVIFDGNHFPSSTLDFAADLNSGSPILLVGIFLPSVDYAEVLNYTYFGMAMARTYLQEYENDKVDKERNKEQFSAFCIEHHIRFHIHEDIKNKVVTEIMLETRYADLMILNSTEYYENLGAEIQEEYMSGTIHKAECPVVLLPGKYKKPENIILAYDGSASCVHAIKQFAYLMPQLMDLPTLVIYAGSGNEEIPYINLLKEYAPVHFGGLAYYKLAEEPEDYMEKWIENKGSSILVSGSFGRSFLSELFKDNFVAEVIKTRNVPLFIAHL